MTVFVIPYPPSVNNLFPSVVAKKAVIKDGKRVGDKAVIRRVKSKDYTAWREEAGWEIRRQAVPLTRGKVEVDFELGIPKHNRAFDGDNRLKAILDLMVKCGVIESDDRFTVIKGKWWWVEGVDGVRVTVRAA